MLIRKGYYGGTHVILNIGKSFQDLGTDPANLAKFVEQLIMEDTGTGRFCKIYCSNFLILCGIQIVVYDWTFYSTGYHECPFLYARIFTAVAKFSSEVISDYLFFQYNFSLESMNWILFTLIRSTLEFLSIFSMLLLELLTWTCMFTTLLLAVSLSSGINANSLDFLNRPPPVKVGACRALLQLLPDMNRSVILPQIMNLFSSLTDLLHQVNYPIYDQFWLYVYFPCVTKDFCLFFRLQMKLWFWYLKLFNKQLRLVSQHNFSFQKFQNLVR